MNRLGRARGPARGGGGVFVGRYNSTQPPLPPACLVGFFLIPDLRMVRTSVANVSSMLTRVLAL